MIYPTRLCILLAAAIAPIALVIGLLVPNFWTAGLALLALLLALGLVDAFTAPNLESSDVHVQGPSAVGVGETFAVTVRARFRNGTPDNIQFAIGISGPIAAPFGHRAEGEPEIDGAGGAFPLQAERRGTGRIESLWVRWTGRLRLVWKQRHLGLGQDVYITPDIRPVREKGLMLLNRDAMHGLMAQMQIGEGAEFEALADYRQGMDRRAIDWKQSARHTRLIAKEYRTERNNQIVVAIDSGRVMCEPLQGVPRVDRAVSAALLAAFVALKDGDRVGLFAFDSRPRASSRPISGPRAFTLLQRAAAGIEYGTAETNYTLGLTTLANGLNRRSLIIVFTEFSDTISAELMLKAVGTMLKRHLVLFVVLRDEELEAFTAAEAHEPADVSRAVVAAGLLRERALVLAKLRHLGVHVIEATAANAGPALVASYVELKRKDLL
jgi:uncharacterized protein (DUF58 family)